MDELYTLPYLKQRLARVFARRSVLTLPSLLYRMCEVGPRRYDPKALTYQLQTPAITETTIDEYRPGIYRDPTDELTDPSDATIRALLIVERIARLPWHVLADTLATSIEQTISETLAENRHSTEELLQAGSVEPTTSPLADKFEAPRHGKSIRITSTDRPEVHIWISHEIPALDCVDPRLWHHLHRAHAQEARAIVIARAVTTPVFALCKALGAYALQYYSMLAPDDIEEQFVHDLDFIGWMPSVGVAQIADHPMQQQLQNRLATLSSDTRSPHENERRSTALATAIAEGFASHEPTPTELLEWTNTSGLELPDAWTRTMQTRDTLRRALTPRGSIRSTSRGRRPTRAGESPNDQQRSRLPPMAETSGDPRSQEIPPNLSDTPQRVPADVNREQWNALTDRTKAEY